MSYLFCSSCAPTLESPAELCLYKTHIYCKRRRNIEFAVSLGIFAILSCVALLCLLCGGSSFSLEFELNEADVTISVS